MVLSLLWKLFYLNVPDNVNLKFIFGQCSMAGRQVFEVPPANIGGSPFCTAVSFRGMDAQKVSHVGLKYIFYGINLFTRIKVIVAFLRFALI